MIKFWQRSPLVNGPMTDRLVSFELVGGPLDGVADQAPADHDGPTMLISAVIHLHDPWTVFYSRDPDAGGDGRWRYRFAGEWRGDETA